MNNRVKCSPYLHGEETTTHLKLDLFIGLITVMVVSVVQNGLRVLTVCTLCAALAWSTETLGRILLRKGFGSGLRSLSIGLIIAMLCPVTVPIWLPSAATVCSVFFVDVLLWPNYSRLFMTPTIAWIFMLSVMPAKITTYPALGVGVNLPFFQTPQEFETVRSIAQSLQYRSTPNYSITEILVGRYPGGMGTTCILMIFAVCVYFIFRKSMAWEVSLSMILTVAVFAVCFNRTGSSLYYSVLYELTAASYIYMAVFVAGDIINAPMLPLAKIAYGVLIGILSMLFRYSGLGEHSTALALIFANLCANLLDLATLKLQINRQRRKAIDKFS